MATRLYFPDAQTSNLSPTISAEWEHQNVVRRALLLAPDTSALATTAYTPDGADHIADQDAHHRQYISGPLAAQTISGNVKAQFQCLEANAGNNLFITVKVFVCGSDASVKETLLAITRDPTLECGTTISNRTFSSIAITSTSVEEGDRIVVEVGLGGLPVASGGVQGHNGSIRWGCSASSGDLPENDTEAGATFRPWIEFDDNIVFLMPAGEALHAATQAVRSIIPAAVGWAQNLLTTTLAPAAAATVQPRGATFLLPRFLSWRPESVFATGLLLTTLAAAPGVPFAQYDWPVPGTPQRDRSLLTASDTSNALKAPPPEVLPFSQTDWPVPQAAKRSLSLLTHVSRVAGPPAAPAPAVFPFAQYNWPVPQGPARAVSLRVFASRSLTEQPKPFAQQDWPLPLTPIRSASLNTWTDNPRNTLSIVFPKPFLQTDWPVPQAARRAIALQTWTDNPRRTLGIIFPRPFSQEDWPVPRAPERALSLLTHRSANAEPSGGIVDVGLITLTNVAALSPDMLDAGGSSPDMLAPVGRSSDLDSIVGIA